MEMFKIIFSSDWEFFSSNWEKCHLNCIGNGALFRPLRHPKKIPDTIIDFNEVDIRIYLPEKVIFTEAGGRGEYHF